MTQLLFAELAFRGWFPMWIATIMGIVAVVAVVLMYRREAGRLPVVTRIFAAVLRATALATILFLLMRPSWLSETRGERLRPISLLIDDSQSMTTRDPRTTYPDKWRAAVANNLLPPDKAFPV